MNNVKELCIRRGIEQKELSILVGVSQPTVSDWFNQKKNPSGKRLDKLSEVLGVSRSVILGYDDDPEASRSLHQVKVDHLFGKNVGGIQVVEDTSGSMASKPETQAIIENIMAKLAQLDEADRRAAEGHIDFLLERKLRGGKT